MYEDEIASHPSEVERLRNALQEVNCRIEALAGIVPSGEPGNSASMVDYWVRYPERTCADHYENPDQHREYVAVMALDGDPRKRVLDACQERDTVIRHLRLTDAIQSRARLAGAEHVKEIAWDSPVLNEAFQCLVKAIDWNGPGARVYQSAYSQIHNPITDEVALDQFDSFTAQALYNGLESN